MSRDNLVDPLPPPSMRYLVTLSFPEESIMYYLNGPLHPPITFCVVLNDLSSSKTVVLNLFLLGGPLKSSIVCTNPWPIKLTLKRGYLCLFYFNDLQGTPLRGVRDLG